jgi:hypothetical protein
LNLERCRKKLEREAKHATVEIFGGKSWSTNFCDKKGELSRSSELRELPRRSELGERMMERGGSERARGFFFFFVLETGRWREAVQIMVDEHKDTQIDNREIFSSGWLLNFSVAPTI